MKEFLPVLKKSPLFSGIEDAEIEAMTDCLGMETRTYQKDELVYRFGDTVESVGLVLSGKVYIVREDFWGNRNLVGMAGPGQTFAESYACTSVPLGVAVLAGEKTQIAFFRVRRVLTTCPNACAFHARLVRNLLTVLAEKSLNLTRKMFHISPKTIRGKLLFRVALGNMDFFTRGLIVLHRAIAGHTLGELIAGLKFFQWVSPPIRSRAREQNSVFSSMPM